MFNYMKSLKEYISEGLLDRVKNKEVNHDAVIEEFLKKNYRIKGSYTIKETKSGFVVDVKGDVKVKNKNIASLTNELFEFGVVSGDFKCFDCSSLTSLEGAPREVGKEFNCNGCNSLRTLEGAPEKVIDYFDCSSCPSLTTLEGAPKEVGGLNCSHCESLISLEGTPQKIVYGFECVNCKSLRTLEGVPEKINACFFLF